MASGSLALARQDARDPEKLELYRLFLLTQFTKKPARIDPRRW
jgi:hypothetical protein